MLEQWGGVGGEIRHFKALKKKSFTYTIKVKWFNVRRNIRKIISVSKLTRIKTLTRGPQNVDVEGNCCPTEPV